MKLRALLLPLLLLLPSLAFGQGFVNCNSPNATCKAGKFSLVAGNQLCLNSTTCTTWIQASTTTAGMRLNSGVANSGSNAAYSLDTTNALSGSTLILNVGTGGVQKLTVNNAGLLTAAGGLLTSGSTDIKTSNNFTFTNSAAQSIGPSGSDLIFQDTAGGSFRFKDGNAGTLWGRIDVNGLISKTGLGISDTNPTTTGISASGGDVVYRDGGGSHLFQGTGGSGYTATIGINGLAFNVDTQKLVFTATDDRATAGNRTSNKASGQNSIANGATGLTVTNSNVAATSICFVTLQEVDGACTAVKAVVPASGSFAVTVNAACTNATSTDIGWVCFN